MTRPLPLYVSLAALALAGCNEKSTESPEDGRDITAENYRSSDQYSGRVMNGYLNGARVWLDLDGNGLYTAGPIEIELPSGSVAVVEGGEPTALSGEGGRFSLDISGLEQEVTVAPDLDPQDYRLHALVIPGSTLEETRSGDITLQRAYILSSPEGTRNISPLTTLQVKMGDHGTASGLSDRLDGINLQDDYILSDNERGRAYSSMLTRFMREQLPENYSDDLRGKDGLDFLVPDEALELLGIALVQSADELLRLVDEAAGGNYASVNVQELALPDFDLELEDPQLLVGQSVSADDSEKIAEITFSYGSDARVKTIEADGCMQPTLFEIARLANADGKIADTASQWLPSVSRSGSGASYLDEEANPGIDERLSFDWTGNVATFDTRTDCHGGASGDLDDVPEITYSWTLEEGRVTSLTADNSVTGSTRTFIPRYENEGQVFFGYELQDQDETTLEGLSLQTSNAVDCSAEPEAGENYDPAAAGLVTATRYYDYEVDGSSAGSDYLLYNARQAEIPLLIRFGLPAGSLVWGVDDPNGFRWTMEYLNAEEDVTQTGLIQRASLSINAAPMDAERNCWETISATGGDAEVVYSYQSLSEYLTGLND